MKKAILLCLFLISFSSIALAHSTDPTDYLFWESGDRTFNQTGTAIYHNDSDSVVTGKWHVAGTAAQYDDDGPIAEGNLSIDITADSYNDFGFNNTFGGVTVQASFYDDSDSTVYSCFNIYGDLAMDTRIAYLCAYSVKGTNYWYNTDGTGGGWGDTGVARSVGWHNFTYYVSGSSVSYFVDGILVNNDTSDSDEVMVTRFWSEIQPGAQWDEIMIWQGLPEDRPTGSVPDTTPPTLLNYNMTSEGGCTSWNSDPSVPCGTEDTSPTVKFNTSENAYCAISTNNQNHTTMGFSNNCTVGESTIGHICTLTTALSSGGHDLYIACKDEAGNENFTSSSGPLRVEIWAVPDIDAETAIEQGINTSEIYPATIYTNQQAYARNLVNTQFLGTFDKIAVKGTQRWLINYVNSTESTTANLFNLTPVMYVLEMQQKTTDEIKDEVSAFINSTYP